MRPTTTSDTTGDLARYLAGRERPHDRCHHEWTCHLRPWPVDAHGHRYDHDAIYSEAR